MNAVHAALNSIPSCEFEKVLCVKWSEKDAKMHCCSGHVFRDGERANQSIVNVEDDVNNQDMSTYNE